MDFYTEYKEKPDNESFSVSADYENLELIRRRFPPVPAELVEFIKTGSRFIIAGHREPDGDCVGSQLALRSAVIRLGKEALVYSPGPFSRTELRNYADRFDEIPPDYLSDDLKLIIVDCTSKERIGDKITALEGLSMAIIDHHASASHSKSSVDFPVYIDPEAPSCTVLVFKLITALGLKLTDEEATLLLFGLCTDTGFFRHLTERNADVFEASAKMVRYGASPKNVFYITNGGKSIGSRILMGRVLSRAEPHFNGKVIISYETLEDCNSFGMLNRDSDSLYQMLMTVDGVQAVVIIRQELADNCTVSLRSLDTVNVAEIASSFGGGGHKNAAGLTMKGDISFVKQKILESFKKTFN